MKTLLSVFLVLASLWASGQQDIKAREKATRDSLTTVLMHELPVNKAKADSVLSAIYIASGEIRAALGNKSMPRENSMALVKQIASRRDEQIERLLTTEQLQKLKAIMAAQKERLKHNQHM